ncbi:acetate/propionate family kinase [uncultured Porticoccus sp.]|uniref:acetate/propionate family kinase n=1 Tax=uncultured Porticoccus sp. TaxID=1256050 RepID=UPI002638327C|nr:acetate/propionate family kinase [uncultured Porticoccus sp.]
MDAIKPTMLIINAGSSSIRFAHYRVEEPLQQVLHGRIERIGIPGTRLIMVDISGETIDRTIDIPADPTAMAASFVDWLEASGVISSVQAIGHRLVHGLSHTEPERITPALLAELAGISPFAPEHLPRELALIDALQERFPSLPQVACFDTAFHTGMPRVAQLLPIPRRFEALGVRRYGFHGLSYTYLMEELVSLGDKAATAGRVILAHLGNGASLAAVRNGKSIDTSMGFTPTSGLPMSSRSGDLEPGVASYLEQRENITATEFQQLASRESGLLGISETSADVRELLAMEDTDKRAREALALFCYQTKKWLGGYTAALEGLDTLVFSGGIGENAPAIRARICEGLGYLGITLDPQANTDNAAVISTGTSAVTVRVIATDEALIIARSVHRLLQLIP